MRSWWLDLSYVITPTLAIIASTWLITRAQREIKQAIEKVHLMMNSQLDLLLTTAKALAHAEGLAEGKTAVEKEARDGKLQAKE